MAYFGIQHAGDAPPARAAALDWVAKAFAAPDGPRHWDRAIYTDEAGYSNVVSVAYWDDQNGFERWFSPVREAWTGGKFRGAGMGTFIEVLSPSVTTYETLFSSLRAFSRLAELKGDSQGGGSVDSRCRLNWHEDRHGQALFTGPA